MSSLPPLTQQVASRYEIDTSHLVASAARAEKFLEEVRGMLQQRFPHETLPGVDIVVIGSIAKRQCTKGSDLDFYGITEQATPPANGEAIVRAMYDYAQAEGYEMPFAGGPTGVFVPRSELESFDLLKDGNRHVFRRMTLVTGSVSVYRPELRANIIRNELSAFVGREREPRVRGVIDQLLLLSRLGNLSAEMLVPNRSNADGGLVPWAKSRTLYRIELAGALMAIIRADLESRGRSREELVESLAQQLDRPPIERLLGWYDDVSPAGQQALATVLSVATTTLELLATEGVRKRLWDFADDEPTRKLRQTFSAHARTLHEALVQLFYREDVFRPWIEELGLFG